MYEIGDVVECWLYGHNQVGTIVDVAKDERGLVKHYAVRFQEGEEPGIIYPEHIVE